MKLIYPILLICGLSSALAGCSNSLKIDKEIDADIRQEIDSLNGVILRALREKKPDIILKLTSQELLKSDSQRINLRRLIRNLSGLKLNGYTVEHQVITNKLLPDSTTAVTFREGNEHEYSFRFYQPGRPTVATFARLPADYREVGFVSCFSLEKGAWKLYNLQVGVNRVQNQDAIDWYYKAQQQDLNGAQIDALIQQSMATVTLRPAGENIRYRMHDEIERQRLDIESSARNSIRFPIFTKPGDETAPQIVGVSMNCDIEGCLPMFTLLTNSILNDTAAISRDCNAFAANLDEWFPGVSNRNKVISVRLINDIRFDETDTATFRLRRTPTVAYWRY